MRGSVRVRVRLGGYRSHEDGTTKCDLHGRQDTLTVTRGRVEHRLHNLEWTCEVNKRAGENRPHMQGMVSKVRVTVTVQVWVTV